MMNTGFILIKEFIQSPPAAWTEASAFIMFSLGCVLQFVTHLYISITVWACSRSAFTTRQLPLMSLSATSGILFPFIYLFLH